MNTSQANNKDYSEKIDELQKDIDLINAKLQAITDYTDDLIATANNVVSHADNVLSVYLFNFTVLVAIIIAIIQWWVGKTRNQHIEEATKKIFNELSDNEDFRDEFINKLINHPNIRENINSAIDKVAKDIARDKLNGIRQAVDEIDKNL